MLGTKRHKRSVSHRVSLFASFLPSFLVLVSLFSISWKTDKKLTKSKYKCHDSVSYFRMENRKFVSDRCTCSALHVKSIVLILLFFSRRTRRQREESDKLRVETLERMHESNQLLFVHLSSDLGIENSENSVHSSSLNDFACSSVSRSELMIKW